MKRLFCFVIAVLILSGCKVQGNSTVESTGTIEATQIDVRCEVSGRLLKLHYDEGDRVKPGDVLAEIDHEKMDYELQEARSRISELDARLALLQHGYRIAEVQKAEHMLMEADIELQRAKRDFERFQRLFQEGVASDRERDQAQTNYWASQKRYDRAQKDYQIFKDGFRQEEIAAAQSAKESAEAIVQLITRRIKDASVLSTASGVISERYVEPGEIVSAGSLLFSVRDLQDTWIMAYISEKHLGKVMLGQTGYAFIDSFPDKKFSGKVTYISPEAEFTPKNIQTKEERVKLVYGVKVQLDNAEELLKAGMPADVMILLN
jgi:HlyD family secretion protein